MPLGEISFMGIFLLLLTTVLLVLFALKVRGRTLLVGPVALMLLTVISYKETRKTSSTEARRGTRGDAEVVLRDPFPLSNQLVRNTTATTADEAALMDSSTEQLWDKLTKSRIELENLSGSNEEGDEQTAPSGNDAKFEVAKPAPQRPSWVDAEPKMVGIVYSRVLHSGPFTTVQECHRALEILLREAVADRLEMLLKAELGQEKVSIPPLEAMGIGMDYVLGDLCTDDFVETDSFTVGEMKKAHVLIEFRQPENAYLVSSWRNYVRRERLQGLAVVASICLGILALGYLGLTIDTWTRGYYTKRLIVGGTAAIILFVVLAIA